MRQCESANCESKGSQTYDNAPWVRTNYEKNIILIITTMLLLRYGNIERMI